MRKRTSRRVAPAGGSIESDIPFRTYPSSFLHISSADAITASIS